MVYTGWKGYKSPVFPYCAPSAPFWKRSVYPTILEMHSLYVVIFIFKINYFMSMSVFRACLSVHCMPSIHGGIRAWHVRFPGTVVIGIFEQSLGAGNWSHILLKSRRWSESPCYLSSPITALALQCSQLGDVLRIHQRNTALAHSSPVLEMLDSVDLKNEWNAFS